MALVTAEYSMLSAIMICLFALLRVFLFSDVNIDF